MATKTLKDQYENKDPRDQANVDPKAGGKGAEEQPGPAIEVEEGVHKEAGKNKSKAEDETRPPEGCTAGEAMEYLKQGDTSCLKTMEGDAIKSVRPLFKEWAKDEQDRLKAEYDRVYSSILAELNAKGLVY